MSNQLSRSEFAKAKSASALSRSEKKALREQIKEAKAKLNEDRKNRPKRKLTEKQLKALEEGRKKNHKLNKDKETPTQQELIFETS